MAIPLEHLAAAPVLAPAMVMLVTLMPSSWRYAQSLFDRLFDPSTSVVAYVVGFPVLAYWAGAASIFATHLLNARSTTRGAAIAFLLLWMAAFTGLSAAGHGAVAAAVPWAAVFSMWWLQNRRKSAGQKK